MPATWLALVQFLAGTDRKPEAENLIHEAEQRLPAKTSGLALAACYEAIGNKAQAASEYKSALDKTGSDPAVVGSAAEFYLRSGNLVKAQEQLQSLISGAARHQAGRSGMGAATLAAVLRSSGQYRKLDQALALVARISPAETIPPTTCDESARAGDVSGAPIAASRQRRSWRKCCKTERPTQNSRMALSGLYLARGDWPKASEQLRLLWLITTTIRATWPSMSRGCWSIVKPPSRVVARPLG